MGIYRYTTRDQRPDLRKRVYLKRKQAGVLIGKTSRSFREFNNTLTLCPALIATEADIDEIVAGIDKAFTTVEQKFGL